VRLDAAAVTVNFTSEVDGSMGENPADETVQAASCGGPAAVAVGPGRGHQTVERVAGVQ
jgi:hypothetical protein